VPFLSKQTVNLGQIKKNVHGYFRMVAKVKAKNTWFLSREVSQLEVSKKGTDDSDFEPAKYNTKNRCTNIDKTDADTKTLAGTGYSYSPSSDYHTRQKFPVAFLKCDKLMAGMKAGWVMRFSLAW